MTIKTLQILLIFYWALSATFAFSAPSSQPLEQWILSEEDSATHLMLKNISPAGTSLGVVIASPSSSEPNYYYHWVRDASLTMDPVFELYKNALSRATQNEFKKDLLDFAGFSRKNQLTTNWSGTPADQGLGEPKFHVDGTPFDEPWGRPQNDGPAIRATTLIRFAQDLLDHGQSDLVRQKLYDIFFPAQTVIKADLEYVSHHWRENSFDLWEEVSGVHFFTRMVQRKALIQGAELAKRLGDFSAQNWYLEQAQLMEPEISKHWNAERKIITATLGTGKILSTKASGLDIAVILGAIHGDTGDGFFSPDDERVLATAETLRLSFENLYPLNKSSQAGGSIGTAIGRYPEDHYDGYTTNGDGNPWFISTAAFAELHYRLASHYRSSGKIKITSANLAFFQTVIRSLAISVSLSAGTSLDAGQPDFDLMIKALLESGDLYLKCIRLHTDSSGALSEQINRFSGYMQGAHDLTWSYSSFLEAVWARRKVINASHLGR